MIRELSAHVGRRNEGFVVHRGGEPVDSIAFSYHRRRPGVTGVRFLDLRLGVARMPIALECSVKAVQRAVGHTSSTTTLNLYVHLWPRDEDRIRQAVDSTCALVGAEDSLRTEGESR